MQRLTAYQFQDGDSGVELLDDILELSNDEEILINSDVLDDHWYKLSVGSNPPFFYFIFVEAITHGRESKRPETSMKHVKRVHVYGTRIYIRPNRENRTAFPDFMFVQEIFQWNEAK